MDLGSGLMHYGILLEVYSATTFVSLYTSEMAYIGGARMVANIESFVGELNTEILDKSLGDAV